MMLAEGNRQIKKALSMESRRKYAQVKGNKGAAYGWARITIKAPPPNECDDWHPLNV
jgi:hypothetical protein